MGRTAGFVITDEVTSLEDPFTTSDLLTRVVIFFLSHHKLFPEKINFLKKKKPSTTIMTQKTKEQTQCVKLQGENDHAFILIGDLKSNKSLILDAWIKPVDFQAVKHYRPIFVNNINKLGFMGRKSEFIKFLIDLHMNL